MTTEIARAEDMNCPNMFHTSGKYDVGSEKKTKEYNRIPQYSAAVTVSISALAVGTVIAWTSPVAPDLLGGGVGFPVSEFDLSMIGSLMPIGAAVSCVPTGYLTDIVGRKTTLLGLVPIFFLGWCLIIWTRNVEMIFAGRFLMGMCVGATCVTAPVYTFEISHKDIRGEVASYFHLMVTIGIVLTFVAGSFLNVIGLSAACAAVPVIFGVVFLFFPETPVYHLKRGNEAGARKSIEFFRGAECDVEPELKELAEACRKPTGDEPSKWKVITSREGVKGLSLSIIMMAHQQLCGINAFTFYTTIIFQSANTALNPKYATIIVGLMEFAGAVLATFLVDRVGRVKLLGASAFAMAVSTLIMGCYFHLKMIGSDVSGLAWLPVVDCCAFALVYAVGYGSIPWILMPEMIPSAIVGTAGSIACVVNWLCAFLVTKFFSDLVSSLGSDVTFWLFTVIGFFGTIFSFRALPETMGKSFKDIQERVAGSS